MPETARQTEHEPTRQHAGGAISPAEEHHRPGGGPGRPAGIDWRYPVVGVALALVIHAAGLYILAKEASSIQMAVGSAPGPLGLCEGARCRFGEVARPRRGLDDAPLAEMDLIEVAVIPQLGMKEPEPQALPELVKYEQPETVEDGINIENEIVEPQPIPHKENLPKPAEVDKRRKKPSLDDILSPRDDDPRKRASALDKIIGNPRGSVYGTDPTGKEGDMLLGQVQNELRRQFVVPTSLTDAEIRRLSADVTLKVDTSGHIDAYSFSRRSGNSQFDSAVEAAVKRFIPKEGGARKLPDLSPEIAQAINARRYFFTFDGKKLVR
jgi:outer membrane biosynthesis protein TonB